MEAPGNFVLPVTPDFLINERNRVIIVTANDIEPDFDAYWEDSAELIDAPQWLVTMIIATGGAAGAAVVAAATAYAIASDDVLRFYFDPGAILGEIPIIGGLLGALPLTFPVLLEAGNADSVTGTAGRDWLRGGSANDTIRGGAGNDQLEGGEREDLLYGGAGDDVIIGGGDSEEADETHTDGSSRWSEKIQGRVFITWDADTIYGEGGSDILRGDYGSDYLDGGVGRDVLWGGMATTRCSATAAMTCSSTAATSAIAPSSGSTWRS